MLTELLSESGCESTHLCEDLVERLNVWWGSQPPGSIRSLKMSTSAKWSWAQRCSRWTSFPQQSYFRLCICSSQWHANASVCCFPLSWAPRGTWCTSSVTLSLSAAFTQFHSSVHLKWFHVLVLTFLPSFLSFSLTPTASSPLLLCS